jgi:hypothetical protein
MLQHSTPVYLLTCSCKRTGKYGRPTRHHLLAESLLNIQCKLSTASELDARVHYKSNLAVLTTYLASPNEQILCSNTHDLNDDDNKFQPQHQEPSLDYHDPLRLLEGLSETLEVLMPFLS